jgi:hypothetical protein
MNAPTEGVNLAGVTVPVFAAEIMQAAPSFSSYYYSIQNPSINAVAFEN